MIYPSPPSYDQAADGKPTFCLQCGNVCSGGILFCFLCGAEVIKAGSKFQGPPPNLPGSVPPPVYEPPPAYAPRVTSQPATQQTPQPAPQPISQPAVTRQPEVNTQAPHHPPPTNPANDMSVHIGDRLIYDFEKVGCCIGEVKGLDPKVKGNIHPVINNKGVTADEWRQWMTELDDIQKMAPSLVGCLCMFCCPGFLMQAILCAMFCPISADHPLKWLPCCYGDWYAALKKWQAKVNSTLMRHNMYAKLSTYKPFQHAPHSKLYNQRIMGKDHNYEMSFLAIALTQQESRKLEAESWDHGVNDKCTSGIGRCL